MTYIFCCTKPSGQQGLHAGPCRPREALFIVGGYSMHEIYQHAS